LAGLVQAADGNLYGTTFYGGAYGIGTVFKITPGGTLTTLHSFDGTDGGNPEAGLVQASNGNLYGTTFYGGDYGTVFEITPGGALTTLHSFAGYPTEGSNPGAALVQATDGNLYGTTMDGGANNSCNVDGVVGCGTIFEITPEGTLITLHNLDGTDGEFPQGGLVQHTNGTLYGTTNQGGANGDGTVFSLSIGLGPFVETAPTSGPVGTSVIILGTNLTGATSADFNGTAAPFTVVSSTEITTTVPAGATTGMVQVTTPSGTLYSNLAFQVTETAQSATVESGAR